MNTHSLCVNNTLLVWGFSAVLILWVAAKAAEKNPKAAATLVDATRRTVKWIQQKMKKHE
jgi:ABC-type nitrate/sulfonate/bicarbonate transport system substrate-binding protein